MTKTENLERKIALAIKLLQSEQTGTQAQLTHIVKEIQEKAPLFHALALSHPLPIYCFDEANLDTACNQYLNAFNKFVPNSKHFYAIKVNHFSRILEKVRDLGFGADVSSGRELAIALDTKFKEILFSGPGKTESELTLALRETDTVVINIDSFGELRKIARLSGGSNKRPKCGVRVSFGSHAEWGKFGIPILNLREFLNEAHTLRIDIIGIQFHISWNEDSSPYASAIYELSEYIKKNLTEQQIQHLEFIDFGGGFRPFQSEGTYPEDTPTGYILQALSDAFDEPYEFSSWHSTLESVPIASYAEGIGQAIDEHLRPIGEFTYYSEPGRIICNSALHVLLKVEDIKSDTCIILNGGTNIIGFERFEFDYFPIVNISNPSLTEKKCMVYGSLCMPQDYWGRSIYADKIEVGDLIVVPYQGALTYANMQDFIKGKVPVVSMNR